MNWLWEILFKAVQLEKTLEIELARYFRDIIAWRLEALFQGFVGLVLLAFWTMFSGISWILFAIFWFVWAIIIGFVFLLIKLAKLIRVCFKKMKRR